MVRQAAFAAFAATSFTTLVGCSESTPSLSGVYFGYAAMENLSPEQAGAHWYHAITLTVSGDKVRLEKDPRFLLNDQVTRTSSDGGFYTFEGTVKTVAGRTIVELHQVSCDYCAEPVDAPFPPEMSREYVVLWAENGSFELDHVRYGRAKDPRREPKAGA